MSDLDAIKAATWPLHVKAERSGIVADILAGRASRFGVALFLFNLVPVYRVLDGTRFAPPVLRRAELLEADVRLLAPDGGLPLLPEAVAYAERIGGCGDDGLIAHAYVRYLGDLNGGRILKRRLVACLGEVGAGLRCLDYPALDDVAGFAGGYRAELDRAVRAADFDVVRAEAVAGFEATFDLSKAVLTTDARYAGRLTAATDTQSWPDHAVDKASGIEKVTGYSANIAL